MTKKRKKQMKKILAIIIFLTCINSAHADITADKSLEMATESVALSLMEKGVEGKLKVSINGADKGFRLRAEPEAYEVSVDDLKINEKTKFWKGVLSFTNKDNKSEKFSVNGIFDNLVSIPVLSSGMARDAVIKEGDVDMLEVPSAQVRAETITQKEKIIGLALKRNIAANTPLKENDLQKEKILSRNSTVNIIYNTPTISLKAIGIAMESGGAGDMIKVKNSSSGKIIQAIIKDDQNVEVLSQNSNPNKTAALY
jgi:flagella basal body P-ring formation protein FlgA